MCKACLNIFKINKCKNLMMQAIYVIFNKKEIDAENYILVTKQLPAKYDCEEADEHHFKVEESCCTFQLNLKDF